MSAFTPKPDMCSANTNVRFSNRPVWVKGFQAIHQYSVDVAHGLALLFGIGTKALPLWGSRMGWNNLLVGLAPDRGQIQADIRSHLIRRPVRDMPTVRWSSRFLLLGLVLRCHAAATSCRVQRNSVPSIQMRCMTTAKRRASATIAFFMPRRLAICIAQALSQDHFFDRSML